MDDLITVKVSLGQLTLLHDLVHQAALRHSKERASVVALRLVDLWQRLDEALDAWEREEEAA